MSFTFNGVNCESLGMVVEKFPPRPFPKRKQTAYSVPGRSGDLIIDEDAFENVQQPYEVYVKGDSGNNMQQQLIDIASWLMTPSGYCELTDTYDPTIKRQARFIGGMEFLNSLNKYGKATAVFDCKPQRYPLTPTVLTPTLGELVEETITIPAEAGCPGYPLIEITDLGANTSFYIKAGTLWITVPARSGGIAKVLVDFETQSIYNVANGYPPSMTTVSGEWPKPMKSGDTIKINIETSPIPTVKIYPRQYDL